MVPCWRFGNPHANADDLAITRRYGRDPRTARSSDFVRSVILRSDHQPGGVLIESMHDAGAADAANAGQAFAAMRNQGVDQRPGLVTRSRMDDHPLRLVDDDQIVVLVNDIERNGFPFGFGRYRWRHVDCDRIPGGDMVSGVANGGRVGRSLCNRDFCNTGCCDEAFSIEIWPARISDFSRDRDSSGL